MSADYTLTPEEQREIRLYITDSINGANINPDKLPRWLAELIKAKSERDALKAEATRLRESHRWIAVDERLPEQDCVVWACRKTASGLREVCRAFVDDYDVWRIDTLSAGQITVTHWQEITAPQPPGGEE